MELIKYPVADRVVLTDIDLLFSKSAISGIVLSEHGAMAIKKGRVLSYGPDCKQVKKGDWMVFEKGRGIDITYQSSKYQVIRECDTLFCANESELLGNENKG